MIQIIVYVILGFFIGGFGTLVSAGGGFLLTPVLLLLSEIIILLSIALILAGVRIILSGISVILQ